MSKFDPERAEILDSKERDADDVLQLLELREDDTVLDLGAGTGFLTVPLSKLVGKVYAVDVQEEMIDKLRERCGEYENVDVLLNEEGSIPVASEVVDKAFLLNVFHEIDDTDTFDDLYRVMKYEGEVCVVDWDKDASGERGPPIKERYTLNEAVKLMEEHGFNLSSFSKNKTHFRVCFKKV